MSITTTTDYIHFHNILWTRAFLLDPSYTPIPTLAREKKLDSSEDALIAETLNSPSTISACQALQQDPSPSSPMVVSVLRLLFALNPGVNGFHGVVHGGMVGVLIDETMGNLLQRNQDLGNQELRGKWATASLKTEFCKPIPSPGNVVVTARLGEVRGRKLKCDAIVEGEGGQVFARGEAIWVQLRGKL